jgi:hypothetical protein
MRVIGKPFDRRVGDIDSWMESCPIGACESNPIRGWGIESYSDMLDTEVYSLMYIEGRMPGFEVA